jgi:hypothetical protein
MTSGATNPFMTHYVRKASGSRALSARSAATEIEIRFSVTLDDDMTALKRKNYSCIGTSDVCSRANEMGLSEQLRGAASQVGADVVLFCVWPAKLRSVRRLSTGEIDLDAVMGDQPASFSSKSYAVTGAVFFRKRDDIAKEKTGVGDA